MVEHRMIQQVVALDAAIGCKCTSIQTFHGSSLIIRLEGDGRDQANKTLIAITVWIIEHDSSVVIGSGDEPSDIERHIAILNSLKITSFDVSVPSFSVTIHFTGGLRLRLFPDAANYFSENESNDTLPWVVSSRHSDPPVSS